jgi:hypothetical protein
MPLYSIFFGSKNCINNGFAQVAVIDFQPVTGDDRVVVQMLLNLFDHLQEPWGFGHQVCIGFGRTFLFKIKLIARRISFAKTPYVPLSFSTCQGPEVYRLMKTNPFCSRDDN